jgi:outer membrane protein TolC
VIRALWGPALAAALLVPGSAAAEALRLADAIERALARHPGLEAAARERDRAAARVDRARAAFLPRLDTSYGYTRSDQPVFAFGSKLNQGRFTAADFEVGRLNEPGATDNFRAAVTLRQPLYTGGKATLGLEQARLGRELAALESVRATQEVIFEAARAYFGLRLAEERLIAVEAAVKAGEANLALASSRVRAGLAVESDQLAAEVRVARLREAALDARSRLGVAQAALNDATGAPLDAEVSAAEALGPRPLRPETITTGEVLARRPDYQALVRQEELRAHDVGLARAELLPTVALEGGVELNSARPVSEGQGSWGVMALLQWNLFGGGADQARIREAVAARDRARALRVRAASRIDLEVRDARARLDAAREQAGVAQRAIAQAEEGLRIVAIRYRGGLVTIVELLNAESALTESRLRLSEAFHDAAVALAAWELARGRLDRTTFE